METRLGFSTEKETSLSRGTTLLCDLKLRVHRNTSLIGRVDIHRRNVGEVVTKDTVSLPKELVSE